MTAAPIHLRDCPMCHEGVSDEGVILISENLIDPADGEEYGAIGYTVRCCNCGVAVSDEYRDEAVRLWNGEPPQADEEEGGSTH